MKIGLIGTLATALCCFTPALVIALGLLGISALTAYLDFVLLPLLGLFLALLVYGAFRERARMNSNNG